MHNRFRHAMLWSRNGNNISASFPEIVDALHSVLDHRETVLDGEIFALGSDGVPSFSLLQRRMHVLRPTAQLRNEAVTSYYVFGVLDIDGTSTTDMPYLKRREALANLSLEHPRIKVPPHWLNVDGPTMLEVAQTPSGRYRGQENCLNLLAQQAISRLDQNAAES
ncbi:ATP-dependent DNA ligase [Rhodococcus erythropolis]|uniref:ATP-dependent DNA ligase n=1 Tax=Rhodococcus erythropolis TaxID=1833 RepID=UPI00366E3377